MILTGGICLLSIYVVNTVFTDINILLRALISAVIITAVELTVGVIVNIKLGWNVWDYSAVKFNFLGQISLVYSFFWYLLSIPASILCVMINRAVFKNI